MKRTDIERRERQLKRKLKKEDAISKTQERDYSKLKNVSACINALVAAFEYDKHLIYNIQDNLEMLELLEDIQTAQPEKFDTILKKAVAKTKIEFATQCEGQLRELADALM